MIRTVIPVALLLASQAIGQCTIGSPGVAQLPTVFDGWYPLAPIGFTFPFCGATYTGIYVSDHGMIAFSNAAVPPAPPAGGYTWTPTGANLVLNSPKFCAYWSDHNVGLAATSEIFIDNTSGTSCTVTWPDMETYGTPGPFTFQTTLYPDGRIVTCLDNRVPNNGSTFSGSGAHLNAIFGVTEGNGAALPAQVDISSSPISATNTMWELWTTTGIGVPNPLFDIDNSTITMIPTNPGWIVLFDTLACASNSTYGAGCLGLGVSSNSPVIGQNWNITTTGIHPISPIGITFFGASSQIPPIPLPLLGIPAPGCDVNIAGILADGSALNVGGTSVLTIGVPNTASLKDASFFFQGAGLHPANPATVSVSNGGTATIGW